MLCSKRKKETAVNSLKLEVADGCMGEGNFFFLS